MFFYYYYYYAYYAYSDLSLSIWLSTYSTLTSLFVFNVYFCLCNLESFILGITMSTWLWSACSCLLYIHTPCGILSWIVLVYLCRDSIDLWLNKHCTISCAAFFLMLSVSPFVSAFNGLYSIETLSWQPLFLFQTDACKLQREASQLMQFHLTWLQFCWHNISAKHFNVLCL